MLLMMFCNSDQKQKINILKWTLCLSVDPPCSKMLSLGGENPAKMQTSCVNPLVWIWHIISSCLQNIRGQIIAFSFLKKSWFQRLIQSVITAPVQTNNVWPKHFGGGVDSSFLWSGLTQRWCASRFVRSWRLTLTWPIHKCHFYDVHHWVTCTWPQGGSANSTRRRTRERRRRIWSCGPFHHKMLNSKGKSTIHSQFLMLALLLSCHIPLRREDKVQKLFRSRDKQDFCSPSVRFYIYVQAHVCVFSLQNLCWPCFDMSNDASAVGASVRTPQGVQASLPCFPREWHSHKEWSTDPAGWSWRSHSHAHSFSNLTESREMIHDSFRQVHVLARSSLSSGGRWNTVFDAADPGLTLGAGVHTVFQPHTGSQWNLCDKKLNSKHKKEQELCMVGVPLATFLGFSWAPPDPVPFGSNKSSEYKISSLGWFHLRRETPFLLRSSLRWRGSNQKSWF